MNKKIIALAIAAAVAAPMAAHAEASVYGKINMAIASHDDGNSVANTNVSGLAIFDEASRLGVKGSSDLGGGLKLIYKMEGAVDMDGNGGFGFDRDTMVGIKGGFGTVSLGRQNTAYKNATGKMDLFADMYGDITGNGTHGYFDQREQGVKYENTFGGVKLAIDMQPSEDVSDGVSANGDEEAMGTTIAVNFKAGPVNIAIATATCGGTCEAKYVGAVAGTQNAIEGATGTKIGVQWIGGAHTVNFINETGDDGSAGAQDATAMTIQYGLKMGKNKFQVSMTTAEIDGDSTSDVEQTSIALVHQMSKATKVYAAYSTVDNGTGIDATGRLNSGITRTTALGKDPSGIAFGISTSF